MTPETGAWLERALAEWLSAVSDRDPGRFAELMLQAREALGPDTDREQDP